MPAGCRRWKHRCRLENYADPAGCKARGNRMLFSR
jgi:hypothetical protein